jgi:hypothetical protein
VMTALDRWWDDVPQHRKTSLKAEIDREKREAGVWLKKAEAGLLRKQKHEPLPKEGDGRDSTNIQTYSFFAEHDTRGFDEDSTAYEREEEVGVIEIDAIEPEDAVDETSDEAAVAARDADEAAARAYLGLVETGETVGDAVTSSGSLKSSWVLVEKCLSRSYERATVVTPDDFLRVEAYKTRPARHQVRGERVEYPATFAPTKTSVKIAYNPQAKGRDIFLAILTEEINGRDGLEYVRSRVSKKTSLSHDHTVVAVPHTPALTKPVIYPRGSVREWDGNVNDPRYRGWLVSGDYEGWRKFHEMIGAA